VSDKNPARSNKKEGNPNWIALVIIIFEGGVLSNIDIDNFSIISALNRN
jgi:hypothetical protein